MTIPIKMTKPGGVLWAWTAIARIAALCALLLPSSRFLSSAFSIQTPRSSESSPLPRPNSSNHHYTPRIVILGGTGRIGTAVATHLLRRNEHCEVVLVGRRISQARAAIQEVLEDCDSSSLSSGKSKSTTISSSSSLSSRISYSLLDTIWKESSEFQKLVDSADCLIHTAGPYLDQKPIPLRVALQSNRCRAYVDVSDPLPYLEESMLLSDDAKSSNLTALLAAGAFPGMSNVLAKEASETLIEGGRQHVQDIRFNYFTAGLGGSGVVNLYITNLGFGEPMVQYHEGRLRKFMEMSGLLLGQIDFFLPSLTDHVGNEQARERVGRKTLFAWPFPEAATVAKNVRAGGTSYAAMGTAPDIWNGMLGILVKLIPRSWWKDIRFSKFMADFSEPLVLATDALLQQSGVGELHAMRIDVTSAATATTGGGDALSQQPKAVSVVQGHESFRKCVGQSCAEFALDILEHPKIGVYLPEDIYTDSHDRTRIIKKLTNTPGTFCYTGPVSSGDIPDPPSKFDDAIKEASTSEVINFE